MVPICDPDLDPLTAAKRDIEKLAVCSMRLGQILYSEKQRVPSSP
jgi:hypothetical protein